MVEEKQATLERIRADNERRSDAPVAALKVEIGFRMFAGVGQLPVEETARPGLCGSQRYGLPPVETRYDRL